MSTRNTQGFTIPELVTVIMVLGVLIGLIFGPFDDLYWANAKSLDLIVQTTDTRGALRRIEREITTSNSFLTDSAMDITGDTPYVSSTSTKWQWTGMPGADPLSKAVLITRNYATNPSTGDLVTNTTCTTPLQINYVFFVRDKTLYRRTLVPTGCMTGGVATTTSQQRTCYAVSLSSDCKGRDALIVTGVKSFTVQYYATSTDSTAQSNPAGAKTVVIKLEIENSKSKQLTSSTMRITKVNG